MRRQAGAAFAKQPDEFGHKLRFSWDSASAHKSAEPDLSILPEQILKPPAHSPDLQRAVEVPHSWIHKEFNKRLCEDGRVHTVKAAIDLLKRVASDVVTQNKIKKLVKGLPNTYKSVIAKGGDWADKRWR